MSSPATLGISRIHGNKPSITDDQIEGILERTVTKQGTSAEADVPRRYLGKRVYVIITKSEGEAERE